MKPRAEDFLGKLLWRKHSSDRTLFFNPVYGIHKHVGNVGLRGYILKHSSLQDDEGKRCYARKGRKEEVIKYEIFGRTGNKSCGDLK